MPRSLPSGRPRERDGRLSRGPADGAVSEGRYTVAVGKDYLKFSAAHFIAYPGFREMLHGHNYQVSVRVEGRLGPDGYVLDFGPLKEATRDVCAELDEKVLVPTRSDCLGVTEDGASVTLVYEDGARFVFPRTDVCLLPIVHSSAEELARYLWDRLRGVLLSARAEGLVRLDVRVAESPGQSAHYAAPL